MARLEDYTVLLCIWMSCLSVSYNFILDSKSEQILDNFRKEIEGDILDERLVAIHTSNSKVSRDIQLYGFHRNLVTTVQLELPPQTSPSNNLSCHVLMLDHLPSGAYVDPDQLQNRIEFGGPQVITLDEIDIEQPEYLSTSHSIISLQTFNALSSTSHQINLTTAFPIHLRYHRPSNDSTVNFANVTIRPPDVMARCIADDQDWPQPVLDTETVVAPCSLMKRNICRWQHLRRNELLSIIVAVPVGQFSDTVAVLLGTVSCVLASVFYLIYMLFKLSKKNVP